MRSAGRWVRYHPWKTFCVLVAIVLAIEAATIPFLGVGRLKYENPGETALMHQRIHEEEKARRSLKIKQQWIPLSEIPKEVVDAVIAAEDGTFFTHGGVDWYELRASIEQNITARKAARGASTITQQLAKNLYLSTSKDPIRKIKEFIIAFLLEQQLSKNRILELYLNVIEWGRGIFGVEAAAQTYFGKSARHLTLDEAARLAAVIPSPLRHRPDVESKYLLYRKAVVLGRMSARSSVYKSPPKEANSNQAREQHPQNEDATNASKEAMSNDSTDMDEDDTHGL
jgi:monofunctional glycosyltransferase